MKTIKNTKPTNLRSLVLAAFATLLTLLVPQILHAATWIVEKDGSGDFTVIQDAIDLAQSGDTILIGPGRFDTFHVRPLLLDGSQVAAILWVRIPDLTIIGSGKHETIIGPTNYVGTYPGVGDEVGAVIVDYGATAEIRDVGIENVLIELTLFGTSLVEDVYIERSFQRDELTVAIGHCDGTVIRRLEMIDTGGLGTGPGSTNVLVEDCYFEDNTFRSVAVYMGNGAQDCVVRSSTIVGGSSGIRFSGTGMIEDCTFEGVARTAISLVGGSQVVARRCRVGIALDGVIVSSGRLELFDSVIEGGTSNTLASAGEIYARGCHILNVGGGSMYKFASDTSVLNDLRYNWWGTSDLAQIAGWINDSHGTTIWQPFNHMPISNESSSVSELKGRFGRQ